MTDLRYAKLADTLVSYSCALQPGDKILIEAIDVPHPMTCKLVRRAAEARAMPLVTLKSQVV